MKGPSFCASHNLISIMKEPTCYENSDNPPYTDLILKNCPIHFQKPLSFGTGLSHFYKLILTLFKSEVPQQSPNIISNRNYKEHES